MDTEELQITDQQHPEQQKDVTPGCYVKARHVLAFMASMTFFNILSLRNNVSVAIVAMYGEFNWNSAQQGLVLGSYFYGYIFTAIPGGYIAKKVGARIVVGVAMIVSSILTLLSPVVAKASFELFVAFRILIGLLQGGVPSALYDAWSEWAPPLERSNLLGITLAGSSFGMFVVLPVSGIVADNLGWEAVFYVTGGISLLFAVWFLLIIHDSPQIHPRISEEEKIYITNTIRANRQNAHDDKTRTPWLAMFTSIRVWAIIAAHFASNWGNYTLTSMLPTYFSSVLRFNLSASGALASLPYIMQLIFTLVGGYATDVILTTHIFSTTVMRKIDTTIGLVGPAVFLMLAGYIGCNVEAAVAFMTMSVGLSGLAAPGCKSNSIDIAPKYNGITFGISSTIANTAGFLAPQIAGLMLVEDDSLEQWLGIFWVSAVIYCVGALFYLIFATGVEQPWSEGELVKNKSEKAIAGYDGPAADKRDLSVTAL